MGSELLVSTICGSGWVPKDLSEGGTLNSRTQNVFTQHRSNKEPSLISSDSVYHRRSSFELLRQKTSASEFVRLRLIPACPQSNRLPSPDELSQSCTIPKRTAISAKQTPRPNTPSPRAVLAWRFPAAFPQHPF